MGAYRWPSLLRSEKSPWPLNQRMTSQPCMRERRDLDRKHLPASTYESWLTRQPAGHAGKAHRAPPRDAYDEWVAGRVHAKAGKLGPEKQKKRRK